MRRSVVVGLMALAGCQGIEGPRMHMAKPEMLAGPGLTIREQEIRGRDRLALPISSMDIGISSVAPPTYAENPVYRGRLPQ
jgi:hypothetical protein